MLQIYIPKERFNSDPPILDVQVDIQGRRPGSKLRSGSRRSEEKPEVGPFFLRLGLFYLWLVFAAYGKLVLSCLLTIETFLLMVESWFGVFCLRLPPVRKLELVFFAYGSPTVSEKDEPQVKRHQLQVKKTRPKTSIRAQTSMTRRHGHP